MTSNRGGCATRGTAATPGSRIGELATRTGLTPAALRMWETRHGFPRPRRLESGRRPLRGARRRPVPPGGPPAGRPAPASRSRSPRSCSPGGGRRLPGAPSVYAEMRRRHPQLSRSGSGSRRCWRCPGRSRTSAGPRRAADDLRRVPEGALLPGREGRWQELARVSRTTLVFAGFGAPPAPVGRTTSCLPVGPSRRCAASGRWSATVPGFTPRCSPPGSSLASLRGARTRYRLFESILDGRAGSGCATRPGSAPRWPSSSGTPRARRSSTQLAENPPVPPVELLKATSLLNRVVAYIDRIA